MTSKELEAKIQELTEAAESLEEPEKSLTIADIKILGIEIKGLALRNLRQKLDQINLPDIREMDQKIAQAKSASQAQHSRVLSLNSVINTLKTALDIAL